MSLCLHLHLLLLTITITASSLPSFPLSSFFPTRYPFRRTHTPLCWNFLLPSKLRTSEPSNDPTRPSGTGILKPTCFVFNLFIFIFIFISTVLYCTVFYLPPPFVTYLPIQVPGSRVCPSHPPLLTPTAWSPFPDAIDILTSTDVNQPPLEGHILSTCVHVPRLNPQINTQRVSHSRQPGVTGSGDLSSRILATDNDLSPNTHHFTTQEKCRLHNPPPAVRPLRRTSRRDVVFSGSSRK